MTKGVKRLQISKQTQVEWAENLAVVRGGSVRARGRSGGFLVEPDPIDPTVPV
jgi:hypothetical protein